MQRDYIKICSVISIMTIPFIILSWYFTFEWFQITYPFLADLLSTFIVLSAFYLLAYLLIYNKFKIGFYIMWITFFVFIVCYIFLLQFDASQPIYAFDLIINTFLSIVGFKYRYQLN